MKHKMIINLFAAIIFVTASVSAQTGGNFTITQSVIASGGGQNSASGTFAVDGTIGQSIAGNAINNSPFAVTSGFWNAPTLVPTAANVSLSGRIMTRGGSGIRNARVTLTAPDGQIRTAITGSFGHYRFEEVPVGATYLVSVVSKRFTFGQPTQIVGVSDSVFDLNFVADEM